MKRTVIFRIFIFVFLIVALEVIGYIAMLIDSRSFDWVNTKNYFRVRSMLMGDTTADHLPRYMTLPYLGYVPYPGYSKNGVVQHNEAGYRGDKVPLKKSGKLRVLCIGGSTTYGLGVPDPSQTYPARLQGLLDQEIRRDQHLAALYSGAEVINAGLEAGTSAEELEQYLFKYRYYRPDIVIIHSGVNDAEVMENANADFQLDYTHYRRLQFHLEPLPQPARFFMHSYFFSYLVIRLFYENFYYSGISGRQCYLRQRGQQYIKWTDMDMPHVFSSHDYRFIPFYRNSQSLYTEIRADGAALLILPNIVNERDSFVISSAPYRAMCALNVQISARLAAPTGATVIPFTMDSIHDPHCWLDDCHLDSAGELNKARIALPYVISAALGNKDTTH
ncbi:MAG: hypothetical protein JST76_08360 [Bacteroidetes bacterium]|nr:hypothetical protein [Bacteroidota bacterium]